MDTKKLRQKILDLAIRGKLVPQDPNDEPAIELFKRINPKFEPCKNELDDIQLPDSWCWTTLESVSTDSADGPFGSNLKKEHYTSNKEVRIIQLSNIGEEGWREENTKYTTFEHLKDISRSEVLPNDIVIAKMMPAGRAILCPNNEQKYVLSSDAVKFHIVDNVDCRYILYAINSDMFRKQVYENVQGVTRVRTSLQKLRKYCLPIPPYQEQLRISNEIKRWFTLIDELESNENDLLKAIDKAKSKILDLAIHGKLVPQDPNDEPAIELLKRINPKFEPCDNKLDSTQLPESWCWTTLGNIFNHNTGKALNKSDLQEGSLLPYITTSNVYWNRFDLSEIKEMYFKDSEIDKCTITKGDLLVCEGGDIGRSAIWSYDYDICIQNHIHRLRAKGNVSHLLYLYVLMFYKWTDRIRGNGIGLQGLSSRLLDKIIVPLPPYQEQLRIVSKIEEVFKALDELS